MLFVFTISFFLNSYGGGAVNVVAPNPVVALTEAVLVGEDGWMLLDPTVKINSIERTWLARCDHYASSMIDGEVTYSENWEADYSDVTWDCDDCNTTWKGSNHPEPSASTHGFRAYCDKIASDLGRLHAE